MVPASLFRTDSLRSLTYAAAIAFWRLDLQTTQQSCSCADSVYPFPGHSAWRRRCIGGGYAAHTYGQSENASRDVEVLAVHQSRCERCDCNVDAVGEGYTKLGRRLWILDTFSTTGARCCWISTTHVVLHFHSSLIVILVVMFASMTWAVTVVQRRLGTRNE